MAKNDYGKESRAAQDVEAPEAHDRNTDGEIFHYGRGGNGNVLTKDGERQKSPARPAKNEESAGEKAKGLLEKIGLKKH